MRGRPVLGSMSMAASLILWTAPSLAQVDLFVANTGNDAWPGTQTQPLRTLEGARNRIRTAHCNTNHDINVRIRGGTYYLDRPFVLSGPQDSGRPFFGSCIAPHSGDWHFITYVPESEGDDVTIHGGSPLPNAWLIDTSNQNPQIVVRKLLLDDVPPFRDLYYKNRRLQRARYPNDGFLTIQKRFPPFLATNPPGTRGYNVPLPPNNKLFPPGYAPDNKTEVVARTEWTIARAVASYSFPSTGPCNAGTPCQSLGSWCATLYFSDSHRLGVRDNNANAKYIAVQECDSLYLENRKEFLDIADEWYFDQATGVLYVATSVAEPWDGSALVVPTLSELVVADSVHHVVFQGLNFAFTRSVLPTSGYRTTQSGLGTEYAFHGADNPTDCPDCPRPACKDLEWIVPSALRFKQSPSCHVLDCRVAHTGGSAIELDGSYIQVIGNKLFDIGGSAVALLRRCELALWPYCSPGQWDNPDHASNVISSNTILATGRVWHDCASILVRYAIDADISNNDISDNYWSGISIGAAHTYLDRGCNNNAIRRNRIANVCRWLDDSGGIYGLGRQSWPAGLDWPKQTPMPSLIEENYIEGAKIQHPVSPLPSDVAGVLLDSGSTGWRIGKNVFYNCTWSFRFNVYCGNQNAFWPACPTLQDWTAGANYTFGSMTPGCPQCTSCDSPSGAWPCGWTPTWSTPCNPPPLCNSQCPVTLPPSWASVGGAVNHVSNPPPSNVQAIINNAGPGPGAWVWNTFSPGVDPY
jgi:Right handed beta helix region